MSFERALRTLHGWLGLLVWPWIILAALTGLYENHTDWARQHLPYGAFPTEAVMESVQVPAAVPVTQDAASALAMRLLDETGVAAQPVLIFGRPGFQAKGQGGEVRVDAASGAYAVQGEFLSTFHRADGARVAVMVNWGKLAVRLHRAGWASDRFGTWPADLTALAMALFGASGLYVFLAPRLRRRRARRARQA